MKAIGYIRISQKDQSNYSLEYQKKSITDYCKRNAVELVSSFVDDGESSYTFDRPDYIALEKFIRRNQKQVKYLIILDHDRFSRNLAEALQKIEQLERKFGLKVLATNEPLDIDPSDPSVFIQRAFKYLMANHELFTIRKRARMGMRQAQESGRHVSTAPFGYRNAREAGGKGILVVDETRAFIIQKIFRDYLSGVPHYIIYKNARKIGFTLRGNDAIVRVLRNCVYAGLIRVQAHDKQPERLVKGIHKPIITEAQYWMAQERLNSNKRAEPAQPREDFPLRGLLKSPCCGGGMTAGWSKGKKKYYLYYRCMKHSNVNISGKVLHEKYKALISHLNLRREDVDYITKRTKKELKKQVTLRQKQAEIKKEELKKIEAQIERLEERMINEELEPSTYKRYFRKFSTQRACLNEEIAYLSKSSEEEYNQQLLILPYLINLTSIFEKMPVSGQHVIMREVFKQGLTFKDGVFRTPSINPAFEHNLLILKEKGLLFLEQPGDVLDGFPSGTPVGIRTPSLLIRSQMLYPVKLRVQFFR